MYSCILVVMVAMIYIKHWSDIDLLFREMPSLNMSLNILEKNSASLEQQHRRSTDSERMRKGEISIHGEDRMESLSHGFELRTVQYWS